MKQIQSYEELSPLLSAQLKRGVMTNTALTQEDWRREIAGGRGTRGSIFTCRSWPCPPD